MQEDILHLANSLQEQDVEYPRQSAFQQTISQLLTARIDDRILTGHRRPLPLEGFEVFS